MKKIKSSLLNIIKIFGHYYEHQILLLIDLLRRKSFIKKYNKRDKNIFSLAPHIIKQEKIRKLALENNIKTLIETGSFTGYMMLSQSKFFKKLFSIELSEYYAKVAREVCKKRKNVTIINGDSSTELKKLLNNLSLQDGPFLFWLDGHYSGGLTAKGDLECPVYEEIKSILESDKKDLNNVILIDDARLFNGSNDYPKYDDLKDFVNSFGEKYNFSIEDDIIVCKK